MSKIAVITINLNNHEGLQKTIESVVKQKLQNFEYIIIDGNSNDGSKDVIQKYATNINYWVSEPDAGIYNAMNKGIKAAQSDFLLFLNSGDTLCDENILEQVEKNLSANYDIYYGNYNRVSKTICENVIFPSKLSFSFFYSNTLCHQATFINRNLFYDFFMYNEEYKIAADWEFFIYAICHKNVPYFYINKTICNFDLSGISSTGKLKQISNEEKKKTLKKYFPLFEEDYEYLSKLGFKRIQQIVQIKKSPIALKVLKLSVVIISFFTQKIKK